MAAFRIEARAPTVIPNTSSFEPHTLGLTKKANDALSLNAASALKELFGDMTSKRGARLRTLCSGPATVQFMEWLFQINGRRRNRLKLLPTAQQTFQVSLLKQLVA